MTVKDVLKSATLYLGIYDDFQPLFLNSGSLSGNATVDYQKLMLAINTVLKNITTNFVKLVCEENFTTDASGKILLSAFTNEITDILSIKTLDNKNVGYKIFDSYIQVNCVGSVVVRYAHPFDEVENLTDSVDIVGISDKTIVLGVVSEYCFISGLFDDAEIWDKRFMEDLSNNLNKQHNINLPKRKWL